MVGREHIQAISPDRDFHGTTLSPAAQRSGSKGLSRRYFLLGSVASAVTTACSSPPTPGPVTKPLPAKWEDVEYFVASFTEMGRFSRHEGHLTTYSWSLQAILERQPPLYGNKDGSVINFLGYGSRSGTVKVVDRDGFKITGSGPHVGGDEPSEAPNFRIDFSQNNYVLSAGSIEVSATSTNDENHTTELLPSYFFARRAYPLPAHPQEISGTFNTEDVLKVWRESKNGHGYRPSTEDLIEREWSGTFTLTPQIGPSKIERIRLWINAFIPNSLPNLAVEVPGRKGETMVPAFFFQDCFATDNRSFSEYINASSRMQSRIEISVQTGEWTDTHKCDQSIEYDCEDGDIEGTAVGDTSRMKFSDLQIADDKHTYRTNLIGASSNPLVAPSRVVGDIDYDLGLYIHLSDDYRAAVVGVVGKVDEFPAFEAYVQADSGPIKTLFQRMPDPGASPQWNLAGYANIPIEGGAALGTY